MIKIIGPEHSASRALLQSLCDEIEIDEDVKVIWGRRMGKYEQLRKLYEAGISVPLGTEYSSVAAEWVEQGKVIWGRKVNHTQGRDIVVKRTSPRWIQSDYWVEQITNIKNEWRIHVMDGKIIHSQRKVLEGPWCRHDVARVSCSICSIIRSRRNGWIMIRDLPSPQKVKDIAKAAIVALEWDLGGVDILECQDNSIYVLEANSRVGLDQRTARQYVRGIMRRIGMEDEE